MRRFASRWCARKSRLRTRDHVRVCCGHAAGKSRFSRAAIDVSLPRTPPLPGSARAFSLRSQSRSAFRHSVTAFLRSAPLPGLRPGLFGRSPMTSCPYWPALRAVLTLPWACCFFRSAPGQAGASRRRVSRCGTHRKDWGGRAARGRHGVPEDGVALRGARERSGLGPARTRRKRSGLGERQLEAGAERRKGTGIGRGRLRRPGRRGRAGKRSAPGKSGAVGVKREKDHGLGAASPEKAAGTEGSPKTG